MPYARLLVPALLLLMAGNLHAQPANEDCSDAVNLCAQQPMAGNNTGAVNSFPSYCQPGDHGVWYTFTTNSLGGAVMITVDDIQCPDVPTMNNELSAVVLSGDGSCTPASFSPVSPVPCAHDSGTFTVLSSALLPSTQYWVMVSGVANGALGAAECAFNISVSGPGADIVNVDFDAGPDVTIATGGSAQLNATGGSTYSWSPTSGLSGNTIPDPVAEPNESTLYTVTTVLNGCTYEDQVNVWVKRLITPFNTFTPNGDGINDTWEIPGIYTYPQAEVSVYDRWGQRVYHSIGYRQPFDGAGLPTATYYWYIRVNDVKGSSDPYTGFVTIVR
jgi:gliding motility-associated-like protein